MNFYENKKYKALSKKLDYDLARELADVVYEAMIHTINQMAEKRRTQ